MSRARVDAATKLIEVALPLDAINEAAAREKSIRHGHPSTLHLWWARRPLAAARAVLFAQLVDDPSAYIEGDRRTRAWKEAVAQERQRLFKIIEALVQWERTNDEEVLQQARAEIRKSWQRACARNASHPRAAELFDPERLPAFHDPFAGGGSIPLEAQRLGLEAWASDLNPVAVTINKAMIEIPPRFAGRAPVGPLPPGEAPALLPPSWPGARGLAEDVRRYGAWMRAEAERRIGHLYPPVLITRELAQERPDLAPLVGQQLPVIAWLWARTVRSPNPACSHAAVPLAASFVLSSKPGKEAYVQPVVEGDRYRFTVQVAGCPGFDPAAYQRAQHGTKLARGAHFECLLSQTPIEASHIKAEGQAGRLGARLMAIVAEGPRGRVYLPPLPEQERVASVKRLELPHDIELPAKGLGFRVPAYGLTTFGDLFTPRQLVALTTFADLVGEAIERCRRDAVAAGLPDDGVPLEAGGTGALAYAQAVGVYLALVTDRMTDAHSSLTSWTSQRDTLRNTFARQALPMVWDFAEANPFSDSTGNFSSALGWVEKAFEGFPKTAVGHVHQSDAQTQTLSRDKIVSTDPPYYDNIGYADLSDFFYVWLRRCLKPIFPGLYATLATPKDEELVATPYRHGSKEAAERFFLEGMRRALANLAAQAHPAFPVTIYYAFKQSETTADAGTSSTGWATFLQAVLEAGFAITGTWPMRTERVNRMRGVDSNALASSIVLVCRRRPADAPSASRREFLRELHAALPEALEAMTRGGVNAPVAPVDLAQAIIGPGMAIFSRYRAVLEADGRPMTVHTALALINRFLSAGDFDPDTQCCLHWCERYGWDMGPYGEAEVLARAKGTAVDRLAAAGVLEAGQGRVRLVPWSAYPAKWSPAGAASPPVWLALHHLIRALRHGDETQAGALLAGMPALAEPMRDLAYRLYTLCERQGWAEAARAYNELVTAWEGIARAAQAAGAAGTQTRLEF